MRVLVTGANGFVGQYLVRALLAANHDVIGLAGPGGPAPSCDLSAPGPIRAIIAETKPDAVVNLAGVSSVAASHDQPESTLKLNVLGTLHLLEAVRRESPTARVLLIGSGEMYGASLADGPVTEVAACLPLSPYAASKVSAEILGLQYVRSYGLDVLSARPFTHIGSGQAANFAVPSFARQVAAIKSAGGEGRVAVGNLDVVRDVLHVADVAAAYVLLLGAGARGATYNVASGHGRSIRSLLEGLISAAGISAEIWVNPERVRPAEIPRMVGDAARLRELGWSPSRTVSEALSEVLAEALREKTAS